MTDNNTTDTNEEKPRGFSSKRNIFIVIISTILALGIGVVAALLIVKNSPASRVNNYLVSGEKYLIAMNYEQAIIQFDKILKIDPMNVDAYIGKAEALSALGRKDEALDVLNEGYNVTNNEKISELILDYDVKTPHSSEFASTSSSSQSAKSNPEGDNYLNYIDVSSYFAASDTLSSIADGRIINATKSNDYYAYKSVFLSDDFHFTELDVVFHSGIYEADGSTFEGGDTPELVHNNGTRHVYKATSKGAELIKTSPYPMYVTQDGYIAYYSSRSNSSVIVNIQSPSGEIVSSTTIDGYSEPAYWIFGAVVDRLWCKGNSLAFDWLDTKGAPFSYFLYDEQVRNPVTGYYDTKYIQYLFYRNGEVVLDEVLSKTTDTTQSYPEKIYQSNITYLPSHNIQNYNDNNVIVAEYYDSNYTPVEGIDGYIIEPEYAAYALVNTETGVYSQLYKEISSAGNKLFIATGFDGKKCYLDKNGREVSKKFEDIGSFDGEYSFALENDTYYLIDRSFKKLLKIEGTNVKSVGNNMFSCIRDQKLYLFNVG